MIKSVALLLVLLSLFSVVVLAEESNVGVLPGSVWYGFDRFFEKTHLWLTFDHAKKARLHLDYARERSAEASAMLESKDFDTARSLMNDYNYEVIESKKEVKSVEGEEAVELSSEIESLTSENNPTIQAVFQKTEEEERLRPEIRNYPYNITNAEEEKLKLKEQTEEELEKELEELKEASKDEGGA